MAGKPKLSDEDFLVAWQKFKSASGVAKFFGFTERWAHNNRRRLEAKLKIQLEATAPTAKAFAHLQTHHLTKARHQAGITDGTVIVFSDAHFWPNVRTTAFKGLLWAISQLKPYAVVNNGDAFDGASISRYPRIGWTQQPSVKDELNACQEALAEIEAVAKAARTTSSLFGHWATTTQGLRIFWLLTRWDMKVLPASHCETISKPGSRAGRAG